MFGIRTALFLWTVVGIFALAGFIGSVVDVDIIAAVFTGFLLGGCVSMIVALRRRIGLWPAGRA